MTHPSPFPSFDDLPSAPEDPDEALARWVMDEYVAEQRLNELQAASHRALRELRRLLPAEPPAGFDDDTLDLVELFEETDGLQL